MSENIKFLVGIVAYVGTYIGVYHITSGLAEMFDSVWTYGDITHTFFIGGFCFARIIDVLTNKKPRE